MKNKTKLKLECSKKEAIDLNVLASMLCLFTLWQNNMTFLINKIISKTINSLQMLVVNFQAFMDTEKKTKTKQANKQACFGNYCTVKEKKKKLSNHFDPQGNSEMPCLSNWTECVWTFYLHVRLCTHVCLPVEDIYLIPCNWIYTQLWAALWTLGIKPPFSEVVPIGINCWVVSFFF